MTRLDLRGLRCPWPAIRVARAIREASEWAEIVAVADDPAAPREIMAVATECGWQIAPQMTEIGAGLRLIANRP
ncbi:sulfurtransferase TusA family protein [Sphingomonas abietis]|uniref:sulfurtransferase TusA family protein n=1 Tax=Sphingomonas abietis TaxID=3012344 RepID=UPI002DD6B7F9|nr:sulfurtransferase TusA family protein [Sphingomonas abietis]